MIRSIMVMIALLLAPIVIQAQNVTGTFENLILTSEEGLGNLSLQKVGSGWVFEGQISPHEAMLFNNDDYVAFTDQDRLMHDDVLYKHHLWDNNLYLFTLNREFTVPPSVPDLSKSAYYDYAKTVRVFNNFEEFTDEGDVHFKDPWYVNDGWEQLGDYEDFSSPYVPTGNSAEEDGAIILEKIVGSGKPYYSMEFESFLDYDFVTIVTPPITSDQWVFVGAFDRDPDKVNLSPEAQSSYWSQSGPEWTRDSDFQVDIEFVNEDAKLFGFYKRHRHSSSEAYPTAINSQRKIAQEAETGGSAYTKYHNIYESDGKIYYTWSEDDNTSWEGELLLSDYYNNCYHPVIDVSIHDSTLDYVISVAYVDATDCDIIVLQRDYDTRPSDWTLVNTISISSPSNCYPSLGSLVYEGSHLTLLAWVDGSNVKYSIFKDGVGFRADRYEARTTSRDVDIDRLTLASAQAFFTPKYPSVAKSKYISFHQPWLEAEFGVV